MNLLNIYKDLYILFQDKELKMLKALINPIFNKNIDFNLFSKEFVIFIKEINSLPYNDKLLNIKKSFANLKRKFETKTCVIYSNNIKNINKAIENKICEKYLNTNNVKFEYKEDKSITSGIKFTYNFQVFDATLDNYLNKIKNEVKNEIRK